MSEKRLPPDTKLISRLEDANDWPTWNQQHTARTHTAPWTDGLQDHTSAHIPLSHSMSLLLYLCLPSHHHLILSQSFCLSFTLTHSVSFCVALVHSALSICLTFCLSFHTLSLTKSLRFPAGHLSSIKTNVGTNQKLYQTTKSKSAKLLVEIRRCKVKQIVFLCLPFLTLSSRLQHS